MANPFPTRARHYRLVDLPGDPHRFLDGIYDSLEEAWADALRWWQGCGGHPGLRSCVLGIEVSTPAGEWRTLRYRSCGCDGDCSSRRAG